MNKEGRSETATATSSIYTSPPPRKAATLAIETRVNKAREQQKRNTTPAEAAAVVANITITAADQLPLPFLPLEIWHIILQQLVVSQLFLVADVSNSMCAIVKTLPIWSKLARQITSSNPNIQSYDVVILQKQHLCDMCMEFKYKESIMYQPLLVNITPGGETKQLCLKCRKAHYQQHPEPVHDEPNVQAIILKVEGRLAYDMMYEASDKALDKIIRKMNKKSKKQNKSKNRTALTDGTNIQQSNEQKEESVKDLQFDFIDQLPSELLPLIFGSFSTEELCRATFISPTWHACITSSFTLWRSITVRHDDEASWLVVPSIAPFVKKVAYDDRTVQFRAGVSNNKVIEYMNKVKESNDGYLLLLERMELFHFN